MTPKTRITGTAVACALMLGAPLSALETLDTGKYTILVEIGDPDMCNWQIGEIWLKDPEKNGQHWVTWCRDIDRYQDSGEKFIKQNFWKKYPNGDSAQIRWTLSYNCEGSMDDVVALISNGVYESGCVPSWP